MAFEAHLPPQGPIELQQWQAKWLVVCDISKSLINEVGILANLAKQEKIASNSLATNLIFLGT